MPTGRALVLAVGLAVGFVSSPSGAQGPESAKLADDLFREGRAAANAGDYVTARVRFIASHRAEPAVGTLLNIADCEDHLDHPVAALVAFRAAIGDLAPDDDRVGIAKTRIAALEKRVARLTVRLGHGAPASAHVFRDGIEVATGELDVPAEVDPGVHLVKVVVPGEPDRVRSVALQAGRSEVLTLEWTPPPGTQPPPPSEDPNERWRTAGWIAGGVGIAGAGLAFVSWLAMKDAQDTLDRACGEGVKVCAGADARTLRDAEDKGQAWQASNYVGWAVAIAGLGGGAALLLTHPRRSLVATVQLTPVGAFVKGRF